VVAEDAASDLATEGFAELAAEGAVLRESNGFFDVGVFVFSGPFGMAEGCEQG
jgi:hypothetical protein